MKAIIPLFLLLLGGACASYAGVSVSAPTNGETVQSPVQIVANASSPRPITGMVVYVDSKNVYSTSSASVSTKLAMSSGTHALVVKAWNSQGRIYSQSMTVQVMVAAATVTPLSVATTSLSSATAGQAYSMTLSASGGKAPYTWSLASGQLPAGVSLSSAGVISGTPTASGNFNFTVDVTDSESTAQTAGYSETLAVAAAPALSVSPTTLGPGTVGTAYSATLSASGGIAPYSWSVASGTLPTGMTLSNTGVINGTPSATGTFSFTAKVKDSGSSPQSAAATNSIVVSQAANTVTPPAQAANYNLMFSDDFTTLNLSPNREGAYNWYEGIWWNSTVSPISDISASNSIMTLNWMNGQGTSSTDVSGCSQNGSNCHAFRYGYFEASMKWDPTTGSWPAFWMIPVEDITGADVVNGVRESGEIDIFEGQGATPYTYYGTIHDWKNNVDVYNNNSTNAHTLPSGTDLTQYHTYGVLWVQGTISWYFDNKLLGSASTDAIFDEQTFYPVFSSQVGVNWTYGNLTGVTATTIPLSVDWVRIWQK
jgi:hypothetical protein